MNLGKVKTFLIVLFLGINIYLLGSMYMSSRFFVDKDSVKATVDILARYDITVNEETVPDYTINLRNIDTENTIYTENFEKDGFDISGNRFRCEIKREDKKGAGSVVKEVKSFLESSGFETRHMKFIKSDKADTWYICGYVSGYRIFDSTIKLTVQEDKYILSGTWFEPMSDKIRSHQRTRSTVYITDVLIDMTHNENIMTNAPFEITDIDYGYLAGKPYGNGNHLTASALPYYRIKDSKGNVYYYDAQDGTYLK
ncbi:MAG: hypothetical protein IJ454_04840 [Clostridia bacterium]|nr:hypothetical protein [Clostridia bacterium]